MKEWKEEIFQLKTIENMLVKIDQLLLLFSLQIKSIIFVIKGINIRFDHL